MTVRGVILTNIQDNTIFSKSCYEATFLKQGCYSFLTLGATICSLNVYVCYSFRSSTAWAIVKHFSDYFLAKLFVAAHTTPSFTSTYI